MFGLAAVVFIANLAHYVYPSIFVLFADYQYQWGPREVGWVLAAVGVCSVIVNAALVGRVVKRLGERRTLLLGLGCGVVGFVIYGFADVGLDVPGRHADQRVVGAGRAGDAGT